MFNIFQQIIARQIQKAQEEGIKNAERQVDYWNFLRGNARETIARNEKRILDNMFMDKPAAPKKNHRL